MCIFHFGPICCESYFSNSRGKLAFKVIARAVKDFSQLLKHQQQYMEKYIVEAEILISPLYSLSRPECNAVRAFIFADCQ